MYINAEKVKSQFASDKTMPEKKPENEPHKVLWMKKKNGNKSNDIIKYKYLSLVPMELYNN